jgi:hypothetical protein
MSGNRYRKIEVRLWGDEKFRSLSPLDPSGQSLWLFLLTGPHTGPIPGLFRAGRAALAEELGWTQGAFDKAFEELSTKGMAKADWTARVIWIRNAVKCNPPQSPNVITSWGSEWQLVPECDLKDQAYDVLKSTAYNSGEAFRIAFDKAFAKSCGKISTNQEQEQEQEETSFEPKHSPALKLPSREKSIKLPSQEARRLSSLLRTEIQRNKADYRITPPQELKWAIIAQRMIDIDKRTPQAIEDLIRWAQRDDFWMANILSMNKLREQFDQLMLRKDKISPRKTAKDSLPDTYVSTSEQIRQGRLVGGQ